MRPLLFALLLLTLPAYPAAATPAQVAAAIPSYCCYCGEPVTEADVLGPDRKRICGACVASAVNDEPTALAIAKRVKGRLEGLGMNFKGSLSVQLKTAEGMARVEGTRSSGETGFTRGEPIFRNGAWQPYRADVYMLVGLPRDLFEESIAHELMHGYMYLEGIEHSSSPLREGAANYLSFLVGSASNTLGNQARIRYMLKGSDPNYCVGFRRAKKHVDAHGFKGLLTLLHTRRDFPPGY